MSRDWEQFEFMRELPCLEELVFLGNPLEEESSEEGVYTRKVKLFGLSQGIIFQWWNFLIYKCLKKKIRCSSSSTVEFSGTIVSLPGDKLFAANIWCNNFSAEEFSDDIVSQQWNFAIQ